MLKRNKWIFFILLIPITEVLVILAKNNPTWVETNYTRFLYARWMQGISSFFGLFPFSVGEVTVFFFFAMLLFLIIQAIGNSIATKKWKHFRPVLKYLVVVVSLAYFFFFAHYRINFYREPIVEMDVRAIDEVTTEVLAQALAYYIDEANDAIATAKSQMLPTLTYDEIIELGDMSFYYLPMEYRYMAGVYGKPKRLILSELQASMGYTGVYSPLTGEPLVNGLLPRVELPFTVIHEISHQRGIAKEDECNYIAFLGCIHSDHIYFKYSGYFNAVQYLARELSKRDQDLYTEIMSDCNTYVQADLQEIRDFWNEHYQPNLGEKVDKVVEANLKSNDQEAGLKSYNQVSRYLLNYYIENIEPGE